MACATTNYVNVCSTPTTTDTDTDTKNIDESTLTMYKNPYCVEKYNVVGVYNDIAHHFKHTRAYQWSWITEFLDLYKETNTNSIIYDIGCGSGRNIRKDMNMIGIDNCDEFLNICKQDNKHVLKGCMTDLPIETQVGDAIICVAAFHHLSTVGRRIKALREMKRVLKPRSLILLSVWSIRQPANIKREFTYGDMFVPWNKNGTIYNRYYYIFKRPELEDLFEYVGLKVIEYKWDCGNEVYVLET